MLQENSPVLCYSITHVQLKCTNIQCTCTESVYQYACPLDELKKFIFTLGHEVILYILKSFVLSIYRDKSLTKTDKTVVNPTICFTDFPF